MLGLPSWASLGGAAEGRRWTSFEVRARLADDSLEIQYDATRRQVAGFPVPDVVGRVEGMARVSLESGRVDPLPSPGPPPEPLSEPMAPMPGVRLVAAHARAAGATPALGGPPANVEGALVAGDSRFAFELSPDTKSVVVHRWRDAAAGDERSLRIEHEQATDAIWVTLDRRHVLLRRAYDQRRYDLFSLETGAPFGSLHGPMVVAVLGPRVYWTALGTGGSLVLTATEAVSGRRLWSRIVRHPDPPPGAPIP